MAEEMKYDDVASFKKMGGGVIDALAKGVTAREIKGLSDGEIEAIYAIGIEQFKARNYETAEKVFRMLALLEHTSPKIWVAYGAVKRALKDYAMAIRCYQNAAIFDLHNPKPPYFAAECFLETGDSKNALSALEMLDMFAPKDTEVGRLYRQKGEALKARIQAA